MNHVSRMWGRGLKKDPRLPRGPFCISNKTTSRWILHIYIGVSNGDSRKVRARLGSVWCSPFSRISTFLQDLKWAHHHPSPQARTISEGTGNTQEMGGRRFKQVQPQWACRWCTGALQPHLGVNLHRILLILQTLCDAGSTLYIIKVFGKCWRGGQECWGTR